MANYRYKAMSRTGRMIWGTVKAKDENALFCKLKAEGSSLIDAKQVNKRKQYRRFHAEHLSRFCKETGVLTTSGVPLAKSVELLSQNEYCPAWERNIYGNLLKDLRQGRLFSDAMEEQGAVFPTMLIQLIRAAEAAGNIGEVMLQMAEYYKKEHQMKEKWKTISTYPKIMTGLIAVSGTVLFGYVLPQMKSLFVVLDEMPAATRMVYTAVGFFQNHGKACLAGTGICGLIAAVLAHMELVRFWMGRIQVHLPVTGRLYRIRYMAQLAEILNSLYASGLSMTSAMQLAKDTIGNKYLEMEFEQVIAKVRVGEPLSESLRAADGFSGKLADAVHIGEEAGSLSQMLLAVANDLRYEAEIAEERMITYLEPAMVIVMAVIVGFLMVAVLLPVYESYTVLEMAAYN